MSDIAIRAEGLSKQYRIGERQKYKALRDTLTDALYSPFRRIQSAFASTTAEDKKDTRTIWALKDVSFEVKQGEVVGVIGRNGAGKSTLLKILSRITEPTEGFVDLHGRVGSLLEVGTGFHPELTGRENLYLNGSIIGMKKREIDRKFDEIVDFAEIEQFLDTPVKYYSSGMYMRLAFSVAAHLEPEILLVDEVLAVGDAAFQKKCLGKMGSVAKEGRTVLFISHNMDAIQRLCSHCIMLERGQVVAHGTTLGVINAHLSRGVHQAPPNEWIAVEGARRRGTGEAQFTAVQFTSFNDELAQHPYTDGPLEFSLAIESNSTITVGSLAVTIYSQNGFLLVNADILSLGQRVTLCKGNNLVKLRIDKLHLSRGIYIVGVCISRDGSGSSGSLLDLVEAVFEIEVVDAVSQAFGQNVDGPVACKFNVLESR